MDYSRLIDGIIANYDLRSELDRRKAYRECVRFADESVSAEEYTEFLRQAGEKLGQQRQFEQITNPLVKSDGKERLHLRFDDNEGAQLVGNAQGLMYLSRVLRNLSQAKDAGEYVYFYSGEAPLDEESIPLAVYLEDDEFFSEMDAEEADAVEEEYYPYYERKKIQPEDVAAFFLTELPPVELGIQPMKIYKVLCVEDTEHIQQDISLLNNLFSLENRIGLFTFQRDDGSLMRLALDMDDEAIGFITKDELDNLKNN